jgi:hypothetical protein
MAVPAKHQVHPVFLKQREEVGSHVENFHLAGVIGVMAAFGVGGMMKIGYQPCFRILRQVRLQPAVLGSFEGSVRAGRVKAHKMNILMIEGKIAV